MTLKQNMLHISLNPRRVNQNYIIYIETINVNFKLKVRCENYFKMILDFIFERILILKQLPDFSSCRVFGTYPGFETILENISMLIFRHLHSYLTKQDDFLIR